MQANGVFNLNDFPAISAELRHLVDLFCLETFSDLSEIQQAIKAVKELCDLPIIAQMTIATDGKTIFGADTEIITQRLDEYGADVIGLNCGVGPTHILTALEKMRSATTKKLAAQPNAGALQISRGSPIQLRASLSNRTGAKRHFTPR